MKHLFMTSVFPPPMEGGSIVYLYNIISNMPPADMTVLTNSADGQEEFDRGLQCEIFRNRRYMTDFSNLERLRLIFEFRAMAKRIAGNRNIGLIHAGDANPSGLVAWMLKKELGIPYIVYIYAEEINMVFSRQDRLKGDIKKGLYGLVISGASGCVVVSDYTADLLKKYGIRT